MSCQQNLESVVWEGVTPANAGVHDVGFLDTRVRGYDINKMHGDSQAFLDTRMRGYDKDVFLLNLIKRLQLTVASRFFLFTAA